MGDELKRYFREIYDLVHEAGKDTASALDNLKRLREKKGKLPEEISDIISDLEKQIPEVFRMNILVHTILKNTGAVDNLEYPIENPVLKENGSFEKYDRSKITESMRQCGIDEELADELSQLATSELTKRFDLGERVVETKYIRAVVWQILYETGNVKEASSYKNYSEKLIAGRRDEYTPLHDRTSKSKSHLSIKELINKYISGGK